MDDDLSRRRRRRAEGERILEYLVKRADGAENVTVIAVGVFAQADGRAVARPVRRLEEAGLVQRTGGKRTLWYPTLRGREVDAILDRITPARGGTFAGRYAAGISISEGLALR